MQESDGGVRTASEPSVEVPAQRGRPGEGPPALVTSFNHAALSVTDLERAISWYRQVFGLKLLLGPFSISREMEHGGPAADIYGPDWQSARLAHMVMPDGTGLELFEFTGPVAERREDNFDYWKTGIFHICFTCTDVAETADRIILFGGRRRSKLHQIGPESWFCFCEDPFGNILELIDQSFRQLFTPPPGMEP